MVLSSNLNHSKDEYFFLFVVAAFFSLFYFILLLNLWFLMHPVILTGVPVRAINRPGSQLLGANGRDDGPIVSFFLSLGILGPLF